MILWAIFIFVVIVMITSGVLISQLAEISEDKGKKGWILGIVMLVAVLVILLVILGIVVILIQHTELVGIFIKGIGK